MNRIKVAIVEDDPDWLTSIAKFLNKENGLHVIATANSRREALRIARSFDIDVILMDINLSGSKFDGIYAAAEISEISSAKIIMLTVLEEPEIIKRSFAAGAVNYIQKANYKEIPGAIRLIHNNSRALEVMLKDYSRLRQEEQLNVLTRAEKEVYKMIEDGHTHSEITRKLYKTERTLKNQVNSILKKLGVSNSAEAIRKIKSKGLL